ncbi:MAG: tetratricopeptide repeat protein [Sphingobacteriales bacterium]
MQKVKLVIAAIILFHSGSHAQVSQETIAGLRAAYIQETNDSAKMYLAGQLANGYRFSKVDSANYYNDLARELAVKQGLGKAEAELLSLKSAIVLEEGKLPEALQYGFEALELAEKVDYVHIVGLTLNRIGNVYMELGDYRKALDYYQQSAAIFKKRKELLYYNKMSNIGHIYERLGMADSALYYLKPVLTASVKLYNRQTDQHHRPRVGSRLSCLICNCDITTQSHSHPFPFVLACNSCVTKFRKRCYLNRNYCDRLFLFVHSTFNPLDCNNDIISNC